MSIAVAISVIALTILVALFVLKPRTKGLNRGQLPDLARKVLIDMENGGFCRINLAGSNFWFTFERHSGSDVDAVLALRIPRTEQTVPIVGQIRGLYEGLGYEFQDEDDNISLIGQVFIPIVDIWSASSGAKPAHAARLLLDAVGAPLNSQFNVERIGTISRRRFGPHSDVNN